MFKRIVIACDSFKACLSSPDVNSAVEEGMRAAGLADVEVVKFPLADGGEGTVDALVHSCGGEYVEREVCGPLAWGEDFPRPCGQSFPGRSGQSLSGRPGQSGIDSDAQSSSLPSASKVRARYGLISGGRTAVIETAAASGLALLRPEERNPLLANTFGTGELILDALRRGCRDFIIGLGGSASNDGGLGALSALGFRFLDSAGKALAPCGSSLSQVFSIARPEHNLLSDCTFRLATDVRAPFSGPHGAAFVFAPQKGATPQQVAELDRGLKHFADLLRRSAGIDLDATPGAGAAGGLAGGLLALLPSLISDASGGLSASDETVASSIGLSASDETAASDWLSASDETVASSAGPSASDETSSSVTIVPGADLVLSAGGFDALLQGASLVITGEGRIDSQTLMGKAPSAVLRRASSAGVPVIAIGGSVSEDFPSCYNAATSGSDGGSSASAVAAACSDTVLSDSPDLLSDEPAGIWAAAACSDTVLSDSPDLRSDEPAGAWAAAACSGTMLSDSPDLRSDEPAGIWAAACSDATLSDNVQAAQPFAAVLAATPADMPLAEALRPDIARANISRAIASFLRPQV